MNWLVPLFPGRVFEKTIQHFYSIYEKFLADCHTKFAYRKLTIIDNPELALDTYVEVMNTVHRPVGFVGCFCLKKNVIFTKLPVPPDFKKSASLNPTPFAYDFFMLLPFYPLPDIWAYHVDTVLLLYIALENLSIFFSFLEGAPGKNLNKKLGKVIFGQGDFQLLNELTAICIKNKTGEWDEKKRATGLAITELVKKSKDNAKAYLAEKYGPSYTKYSSAKDAENIRGPMLDIAKGFFLNLFLRAPSRLSDEYNDKIMIKGKEISKSELRNLHQNIPPDILENMPRKSYSKLVQEILGGDYWKKELIPEIKSNPRAILTDWDTPESRLMESDQSDLNKKIQRALEDEFNPKIAKFLMAKIEDPEATQEEIAKKLGVTDRTVRNYLDIIKDPAYLSRIRKKLRELSD